GADDVVVVTGGARGIGAACVRGIAASTEAKLVLIGRSDSSAVADILAELGERATYVRWDVADRDPAALRSIGATVVIHAAGVIRDALVQDKSDDDVRAVAAVKVDGLRNVLEAAGDGVRQVVAFGSWSGRYGNARQTDYAAANDAMSEMVHEL